MTVDATLAGLSASDRNAYTALTSLLANYGLDSLAPTILNFIQQGYDQQTTYYLLQQTSQWQQRFAGNQIRQKAGLAELDPATYLDLESQYSSVLNQFGIPAGQYGRSDFAKWIGGDVSPSEIQSRVQLASNAVNNADPFFKNALSAMGIDSGHQISYFLDQSRAEPFLQHQYQAAEIGAAALRNNLNFNPETALTLASLGITGDQAQSGYSQIAKMLPRLQDLSQITPGAVFDQNAAEQDVLFGNAAAARQAQQLMTTEQARFAGSAAVGTNIYHPAYGVEQSLQGAY